MSEKQDLRVRRTNEQITKAFFSLLKEKGFKAMTVQDISRRARIGRSTFYSHYYDKYDLLEKLVTEYTEVFRGIVNQRFKIHTPEIGSNTVKVLIVALTQYREILLQLFDIHTETADLERNFRQILRSTAYTYFQHVDLPNEIDLPLDYLSDLYASNVMLFLLWQLRNGKNDSVIQFGDRLQEFVLNPTKGL
ncbi:TetR/AcrR family transcriptional regulator [Secundilactobacillus folii]|uniref:TetR family transcriptional regulator n=1 Tax=Secundilactobacillus folii TaxID=2678357 RepID=A0A7X2XYV5_9LACO|nr:TetR/AcrR family transcriptional regulator [Secundilactobacillus folii]MTV82851.1 TetR family transcriptional regulator [Secundilactobacillus folii]